MAVAVFLDGTDGTGEPFEFAEGISVWPTELCRLLVVFISVGFFSTGFRAIRKSNERIRQAFLLSDDQATRPLSFWERWKGVRRRKYKAAGSLVWAPVAWVRLECRSFWQARKEISLNQSLRVTEHAAGDEEADEPTVGTVWQNYLRLGNRSNRCVRFIPIAVAYLLFTAAFKHLFPQPQVPYRGEIVNIVDSILGPLSEFLLVVLTFFVVDATRLCAQFIYALNETETHVADESRLGKAAEERGLEVEDLSEYADVEIIAMRTETIGRMILYPFIILFVLIISRLTYFDNWPLSVPHVLNIGALLIYAVYCAVVLRRAAETRRRSALSTLTHKISQALSVTKPAQQRTDAEAHSRQLELLVQEIKEFDKGAFAPWTQHPILRAVAIPFSGVGAISFLELIARLAY